MANSYPPETALGMVETRGLAASIEAADAMRKVAHVRLERREEIGGGFVTIMVRGEIGAVKSSVDVGVAAAKRAGELVAGHVIARPHPDVDRMLAGHGEAVVRALAD